MTFNSLAFLGFLLPVIILYYGLPGRLRALWVFLASAAFYAFYNWKVLPFLIIYGLAVHFLGIFLEGWSSASASEESRSVRRGGRTGRVSLGLSVILLLAPLAICKYTGFVLSIVGREMTKSLVLPLGISYFTFKSVGYLVDVHKGKSRAERDPIKTLAFVTFFPEILTGPIDRAGGLLKQLGEERPRLTGDVVRRASLLFLTGCFQKMVIADRIGLFVDTIYGSLDQTAGLPVAAAAVGYSLQIYFDFAGCTLMALGVGKMMGFKLPENFRRPYLAQSVSDFWRRWHISLTSWLRDYIYIPLGGNRKGTARKYLNILIVFAVSGLWHGAGWTFLIWGLLNGVYQVAEGVLGIGGKGRRDHSPDGIGNAQAKRAGLRSRPGKEPVEPVSPKDGMLSVLRRGLVFILITITWVFFRAPSIAGAGQIFGHMGFGRDAAAVTELLKTAGFLAADQWLLVIAVVLVFVIELIAESGTDWLEWAVTRPFIVRCLLFYILIFSVIIFGIYGTAYDAASFIYLQF